MTSPRSNGNKSPSPWLALKLAWELGYLIAIPVVVLGFGGAMLDNYIGTMPLFTLLGFAVAALFSGLAIRRRLRDILS